MNETIAATGQPITPEELRKIIDSSEVIDLTKVNDLDSLAQPLKPYIVSTESGLDGLSTGI
ncbi:hypothetical protein QO009_002005 [Brevibacillus aydinogluensis]|uniref:hypothetical protein n=1 Tax=Brevibacillus aydinogluensis TaxID=927786 RepID=UPI002892E602|nr:hypothetical protein [Brevibacillus aydinogluensis]MDT3416137.1 hypothetical protein [Brevibacillus aydinogluensis]